MTLQQLRYLMAIAEHGSMNAAAGALYASQSNLSCAVADLEEELGITIFTRSNRGVTPTNEGTELLGYARQVVEQADMLQERYTHKKAPHVRLAVSSQHYAFSVQAFIQTAEEYRGDEYELILRECATSQIIDDVRDFRSEIGILYLDDFNHRALRKILDDAALGFFPLFDAKVNVFVGENHPLAKRDLIEPRDLADWPRYSFEQGIDNPLYFAEEPLSYLPHKRTIRISDRGTLTNLLTNHNGYTLSTGVLSSEMHSGIAAIPLNVPDVMHVGYIIQAQRKPTKLLDRYVELLKENVKGNPTVAAYRGE